MSELHTTVNATQLNSEPNPSPNPATNDTTKNPTGNPDNQNWNTFSARVGSPATVVSSRIDNPGVVAGPPTGSPVTAPVTSDPALLITTADARTTYQWPDGSWRPYAYNPTAENLAYGTGPLYANAGGFGNNQNPGTYPPSPFNPGVAQH
jgi:hypothetical protein